MTKNDVLELLKERILEAGSQKAFCAKHDISTQYITDVMKGRREPGDKVLTALGVEKIISYDKKKGQI